MEEVIGWAWDVFQPLLFGLIGAEIRVSELEGHTVGEINRHTNSLQNNPQRDGCYHCEKFKYYSVYENIFA